MARNKEQKLLVGSTSKQRLDHAEVILRRMLRRAHKTITAVVPPIPLSIFVKEGDDEGVLMRYLFPAAGQITYVSVIAEEFPQGKDSVELAIKVVGVSNEATAKVQITRKLLVERIDLPISAGDRLIVKGEGLKRVWFAALYEISPGKGIVIKKMIEALESEEEEG